MAKRKKESANIGTGPSKFDQNRWQAEADLDALGRAYAVRKDPERMKRVKVIAKEKAEEIKRDRDAANYKLDIAEGETPGEVK